MIGGAVNRPAELAPLPGLAQIQTLLWIIDKKAEIGTLLDQVEDKRVAANNQIAAEYGRVAALAAGQMKEADELLESAKSQRDGVLADAAKEAADMLAAAQKAKSEAEARAAELTNLRDRTKAALDEKAAELEERAQVLAADEKEVRRRESLVAQGEAELQEKWAKLKAAMGQ